MKHEVMARAMSELDDDLVTSAYDYRPRRVRAFPRVLAAAACLALILTAALTMTHRAPETDILIGGTVLAAAPIPIDQPAPMALDPAESVQPLEILLTVEGKAGEATAASVSGGTLSPEAERSSADTSCTVVGETSLVWRVETPDKDAVYTLSLDGKAAVALRFDSTNGYWVAERP